MGAIVVVVLNTCAVTPLRAPPIAPPAAFPIKLAAIPATSLPHRSQAERLFLSQTYHVAMP